MDIKEDHIFYDDDHKVVLKSPMSKVYLLPQTEQIINCAIGLKYPPQLESLKEALSNSIMIKHHRFCSLMVTNPNGVHHWKKTHVNIDDHIIVYHHSPTTETATETETETAINGYLADMAVSTPLSRNKPLWELHVLMGLNCVVLRVQHALGDGVSLMSMLLACFGNSNNNQSSVNCGYQSIRKRKKRSLGVLFWELMKTMWFTSVFGLKLLGRLLWIKDENNVFYGGDGVELWPREIVTAKFKLDDFKFIKKAIPNATVNDVLLGIISCGLSKYLATSKTTKDTVEGWRQITGIVMVNLRNHHGLQEMSDLLKTNSGSSQSWGNKISLVLQPICCSKGVHPLDHVKVMKTIMDQKKKSYEAHISHIALQIASNLYPKVASWCCQKILYSTTLLISNIVGPSEEMVIAGNLVTYIRVNISSLPQAITMHMVSYAGRADLQVMVAKEIIPDSQLLIKCFQDALLEMKIATKLK